MPRSSASATTATPESRKQQRQADESERPGAWNDRDPEIVDRANAPNDPDRIELEVRHQAEEIPGEPTHGALLHSIQIEVDDEGIRREVRERLTRRVEVVVGHAQRPSTRDP